MVAARPNRSDERIASVQVRLEDGTPQALPLDPALAPGREVTLWAEVTALDPAGGRITAADWCTPTPPRQSPELMLSVTTFRREDAATRTADRFEDFAAAAPMGDRLHMCVVDNGQSLTRPDSAHVTLLPNANLGGAGGFARGLREARARGATHCLFMDDDAAVHMDAVARTWTFLAYATDPAMAVAGALAHARQKWMVWESGATFHRLCRPEHGQMDLRLSSTLREVAFGAARDYPANFYGGWWYFAFPVAAVRHDPFPFFVRGDDVSFGLMNDFTCATLPGVMCHQDADFWLKESAQTLYLDLRGHLAHHLVAPQIAIGRTGLMKIVAWFYLRSLFSHHYETIAALALSLDDAIAGPDFFEANADMSMRRAQIAALIDEEAWRDGPAPGQGRTRLPPDRLWVRVLMKLTLNGHLLPFFRRIGDHRVLPAAKRGVRRPLWGAARITYLADDGRHYTVTHSKRRAWRVSRAYWSAAWRLWRNHDRIRDDWRQGYARLTRPESWKRLLGLDA